jgi:hypothetical protein
MMCHSPFSFVVLLEKSLECRCHNLCAVCCNDCQNVIVMNFSQ